MTAVRVTFTTTSVYDTTVEDLADMAGVDPLLVQMMVDAAPPDPFETGEVLDGTWGHDLAPRLLQATVEDRPRAISVDSWDVWSVRVLADEET